VGGVRAALEHVAPARLQEAFATAFAAADRVTIAGVHRREQLPESERLSRPS